MIRCLAPRLRLVGVALLLLVAFPAAVQAQYTTTSDGGGGLIITAYTGSGVGGLVIPSRIHGLPVTSIGEGAFNDSDLTSVTVPNSVTSIGDEAFEGTYLISVTIPNSVTSIGDEAFESCNGLTSVSIGNSVTSIGAGAFENTELNSVTIPASVTSIGVGAFSASDLTSAVFQGNAPTMGGDVFGFTASGFTVYYNNGATGFTSPTWTADSDDHYPAVNLGNNPPPVIISAARTSGTYETVFGGYTIVAIASPASFNATGLPTGLSINTLTGVISGTPTQVGTFDVELSATNVITGTGTATLILTVNPAEATVTLTPASLAAVYDGTPKAATATTVPAGLEVDFTYMDTNGYVSLTAPIVAGIYLVTARVNDADYFGSTIGGLTISSIPPLAVTSTAAAITDSTATLNGTSNPEGSATTVSFQYGTTTSYTNTTTGQSAGSGTASVPFSTGIGSLAPATIYHYRAVATNGGPSVYGADKTFTTLPAPVFTASPAAYLAATGAEIGLSVNPGGVATTIYFKYSTSSNFSTFSTTAAQSIGSGKVPVNIYTLFPNLLAGQLYYYQVIISSAAVGTDFPGPSGSFTTLPFDTTLVAQKGEAAPGVSGGTFATFGNPAVNTIDGVAFAGTLTTGAGGVTTSNDLGVWADDNTGTLTLIAQSGSGTAPGTTANFLTFSDPVYNNSEAVAFRGTLKVATGQATTTTATGVWATTGSPDSLALVAQQGGAAPTAPPSAATFDAFTSLGLTDAGNAVLYATLNTSTAAGVTTANNSGIWEGSAPGNLALLLRLGQTVGGKTISKLTFLPVETTVNGQTREFNTTSGDIVCGAAFSDKTTGIVTVTGGTASLAEVSGGPATGGATFASFGNPTINTSDDLAFEATLTTGAGGVTTGNDLGLWTDTAGTLALIAQSGGAAPGTTPPANFLTFSDPVCNNNEAVAFRATLKVATGQATSTTATGVWATNGSPGSLALVAQQGVTPAPGCPAGATFSGFTELALADQGGATDTGGVMMLATLNTSSTAGVTTTNNLGIWAVDTTGALRLIARTGDTLNGKTVTGLAFLPAETTVNGQSRSFAQASGDLVYLATFSDKSTAIFNVVFP